jgi:tape measure domain-containing protein
MTADSTILVEIKSDGAGAKVIKRDLDDIAKKSDGAKKSALDFGSAFNGVLAGLSARAFMTIVDSLAMVQGRLQNATKSAGEASQAFEGLKQSASSTGAGIETLASVFQRLSFSRDEIGATIDEMVRFTDIVSKLGVVSGASTTGMQAGLMQLGQALSAGIVRAEEWNSIMENIPAVGKAIADQFGVTTGQLRNLVINGLVPSEDAFRAILLAQQDVEKQFANMPITIGRSLSVLQSEFELFVGQTNEASGVSVAFIAIIDGLRIALNGLAYGLERVVLGFSGLSAAIRAPFDSTVTIKDVIKEYDAAIAKLDAKFKTPQNTVFDRTFGSGADSAKSNIKDTGKEVEALRAKYAEMVNTTTKTDVTKSPKALKKTLDEATKSSDTLAKSLDDGVGKAVDDLTNKIDRDFADAFKSAFTNSDGGFKKLLEGWKAAFKNFIAEIAYQALARPVIMSIVGSVAGSGSASASSVGSLISGGSGASSSGGIGGLSSLSNLGSLFSGGLNTPIFSAGSAIGSGINSIGASLGLNNSSFIGPMMPGTSNLASSFTPASGLAGFAGNFGANMLLGNRGVGANVGGTIGGIAGSYFGPIGAAIGSFLGNAIGGLFGGGGKPSDKSQGSILNLGDLTKKNYGMTGDKYSAENRKYVDSLTSNAISLAETLKKYGATLSGGINILAGNRDGLRLGVNGKTTNYGTNTKAFQQAIVDAVISKVTDAPDDLKALLEKTKGFSSEKLAEAFGVYELVKSFEDAGEVVKPLEVALKALDEQFNSLKVSAAGLGISTDKITESYEKQRTALIQNVLSPLQDFLDSQALSGSSSLNPAQRLSLARSEFDTNLSAIKGGDLTDIDNITNQASTLLSIGRDIFASGESFAALESYVRQSISGIAGDLGAPNGLNDSVAREISLASAQQISIQSQMLIELQETRAENTKLRKTLERLTNQVVIQA